jgi:hypothetical protein
LSDGATNPCRSASGACYRVPLCNVTLFTGEGAIGNDRAQVRQFIGVLRGLAIAADAGVLLTSHPSLAGMSSGTGISGSTAWHASVRSRLYMKRATTEKNEEPDPNLRIIEVMKTNYGPVGETSSCAGRMDYCAACCCGAARCGARCRAAGAARSLAGAALSVGAAVSVSAAESGCDAAVSAKTLIAKATVGFIVCPPSIPVPGRLTKHFDSVHFSHIAWRVRDGAAHECDVPHSCKADVADILTAAMQEAIILLAEKPRADRCGLGGLPGHNHKSSWPCLSRPSTFFLVSVRRLLDSFESLGFDGRLLDF